MKGNSKSIELTNLNQDDHPEYFYEGSVVNSILGGSGEIAVKTAKNPSEIVLVDNMASAENGVCYNIRVMKCDPANLPSG